MSTTPELSGQSLEMHSVLAHALSRRKFIHGLSGIGGGLVLTPGLAALLEACASSTTSSPSGATPKAGGTLKAGITGQPETLDPVKANIYASHEVFGNIFSALVQMDPNGGFYGQLATKWSTPDSTTWVFDLRDNVYFHNGEKFTAADVKYSFDRLLDPATASPWANLFAPVASVEVVNPTQIVFHLTGMYGPFLTYLAQHGYIMNKKAVESADPTRNPVGTGPFKFVEWVQGDHVKVQKFDRYFQSGRPYLNEVDFLFRPVDESRIQALRSGELHWIDALPLQDVTSLKSDPAFKYITSSSAGVSDVMQFNTLKPPFNHKALRQAVAWATDRTQIRDIAYFGTGEIDAEEVGSASPLYDGKDPFHGAPNLAMAKAKLAEAGFPNGLQIESISLPQYPGLQKTTEVLQQNLKAIGIDLKITGLDVAVWVSRCTSGDFQIVAGSYSGAADPDIEWYSFIDSKGGVNWSGYNTPQTDHLIEQARAENDVAKRKALYSQLRQIIGQDVPLTFVHYETIQYLMAKNVVGSTINAILQLRLENVGFSA